MVSFQDWSYEGFQINFLCGFGFAFRIPKRKANQKLKSHPAIPRSYSNWFPLKCLAKVMSWI